MNLRLLYTSPKVISTNFTLDSTNAGANDALVSINKTHVRIDNGYTLDITGDSTFSNQSL